jgi:protein-tyrosine kinase
MEPIKRAVGRAKADAAAEVLSVPPSAAPPVRPIPASPNAHQPVARENQRVSLKRQELNWTHLERHRIVAHNVADPRSRAYDVLRTQVLQSMDKRNWRLLAVTSPTENCGKTLTAVNLALSIARQPERSAVLVDLDLQRPKVAGPLGLKCERGVISTLAGRTHLLESMVDTQIGGNHCPVLPAESRSLHSSELLASRAFRTMLEEIKTSFPESTIVLDLPPVISGDDVMTIMPYVDCFLLVAAVGVSSVSDIRECNKHLHSAEILRIVLNKATEQRTYYGY